jgi:hypothetical protein
VKNSVPAVINITEYYIKNGYLVIDKPSGVNQLTIMFSVLVTSTSPYYYVASPLIGKVVSGYINTTFASFAQVMFFVNIAPIFSSSLSNVTLDVSQSFTLSLPEIYDPDSAKAFVTEILVVPF